MFIVRGILAPTQNAIVDRKGMVRLKELEVRSFRLLVNSQLY